MLGFDDPLPVRPERVLIAGVTGAGKTTLAGRIGELWELRHVEIDGLFHGPNWTPRPEFIDDVRRFAAEERWVTERQYSSKGTDEILAPTRTSSRGRRARCTNGTSGCRSSRSASRT